MAGGGRSAAYMLTVESGRALVTRRPARPVQLHTASAARRGLASTLRNPHNKSSRQLHDSSTRLNTQPPGAGRTACVKHFVIFFQNSVAP